MRILVEDDTLYIENLRVLVEQAKNDMDFEENGLTDANLEKQVEINKVRAEYNIVDEEEVVYRDKSLREFVQ